MLRLGLTGSIATGKSTTAGFFREEGVPVHDADAAVHAIYSQEGVGPVGALIPQAVIDGRIDRPALKAALSADPGLFPKLEAIVHPLVQAREAQAAGEAEAAGAPLMVFDIPLLFETGAQSRMDKVAVVTCQPHIQLQRLMARPGMDERTAKMLMDRQLPQADKIARADIVITTDGGLNSTRMQVRDLLAKLQG